jgi:hypothetical protein
VKKNDPVQDAAKRSAMEKKREKEARNNAVTPMSENTQMEFDAILKASKHFSYKARHAFPLRASQRLGCISHAFCCRISHSQLASCEIRLRTL